MNKINYQKELEKIIRFHRERNEKPRLLLHVCCAPCSSYVLEYLNEYFDITVCFYNPNISTKEEYDYRASELKRLISETGYSINVLVEEYDPKVFYDRVKGLENCKEGTDRCFVCYELRLKYAAEFAKKEKFDYFTTTLSISPLKNAEKLNEIGKRLSVETGVAYLFSDFKKNNGYKRSVELSKEHNLYRQNFCGCVFSKREY